MLCVAPSRAQACGRWAHALRSAGAWKLGRRFATDGLRRVQWRAMSTDVPDEDNHLYDEAAPTVPAYSTAEATDEWSDLQGEAVPEGFPARVAEFFGDIKRTTLLVRSTDMLLEEHLFSLHSQTEAGQSIQDAGAVYLDGPGGSGKSASVLRLVCAARNSGWTVLYIPDTKKILYGSGSYVPWLGEKTGRNEDGKVWWYDRPEPTLSILKSFKEVHGNELARMEITSDGCDTTRELLNRADTSNVLGLVDFALDTGENIEVHHELGPKLIGDVFDTMLNCLCGPVENPVLIAIDDWNSLVGLSDFFTPRQRRIHSRGIRLSNRFINISELSARMQNGFVVAANSKQVPPCFERRSRVVGGIYKEFMVTDEDKAAPSGESILQTFFDNSRLVDTNLLPTQITEEHRLSTTGNITLRCSTFRREEWLALVREYQDARFLRDQDPALLDRIFVACSGRAHLLHHCAKAL
ncbi:hypothetical protein FVE85_7984 [Porphyridium purpureum]|uniref:Small ribosomal subunit protein mS29 n=1 Tax=Porphyridium purpureum TaxID=35688 RepID=A0A5J4YPZ4_PORPP|nr:hypothetical protein FVE85_7984 [Porphyridium purpureum]|eukprot:POR7729..scf295_9